MNTEMSSQRQIRYSELIRSLISECILKEDFYDSSIDISSVTISFVKMSKDLRFANIYLMPLGGKDQDIVLESINKNKYIFQKYLSAARLQSKFTPKINFYIDNSFDEAEKIKKLLLNRKVLRDLNG